MRRCRLGPMLVAVLAVVPAAVGAVPAHASPVRISFTSSSGMNIGGFDRAVASKAGYDVKTWSDGSFQLVPRKGTGLAAEPIVESKESAKNALKAQSYPWDTGSDTGNCGTNFNTVEQTGPHKVYVETGFYLNKDPILVDWRVRLVDQNGKSYHSVVDQRASSRDWNVTWYNLNQYVKSGVITTLTGSMVTTKQGYICYPSQAAASIKLK